MVRYNEKLWTWKQCMARIIIWKSKVLGAYFNEGYIFASMPTTQWSENINSFFVKYACT